jgi:hypothetical protein
MRTTKTNRAESSLMKHLVETDELLKIAAKLRDQIQKAGIPLGFLASWRERSMAALNDPDLGFRHLGNPPERSSQPPSIVPPSRDTRTVHFAETAFLKTSTHGIPLSLRLRHSFLMDESYRVTP